MICIDEREEGKPVTSELVRLELPVRYYAYDEAGKGNGRKMLQLLPIYAAAAANICCWQCSSMWHTAIGGDGGGHVVLLHFIRSFVSTPVNI